MYTRLFLFGLLLFLSSCGTRYASITYREVDKNESEENTVNPSKIKIGKTSDEESYNSTSDILKDDGIYNETNLELALKSENIVASNRASLSHSTKPNKKKSSNPSAYEKSDFQTKWPPNETKNNDPYINSEIVRLLGMLGLITILTVAILGLLILIFIGEPWQLILAIIGMACIITVIVYFIQRLYRTDDIIAMNKKRWIIALSIGFGLMTLLFVVLLGLDWF